MDNRKNLINECLIISDDSLYTAQTHYVIARAAAKRNRLFIFWPSILSGVAGIAIPLGVYILNDNRWALLGIIPAVAGIVTAVAAFLGSNDEVAHKAAGNLFTVLRHDSRAMAETFALDMPLDQLTCSVKRLQERYNSLVQSTEITDSEAFEKARGLIKKGRFDPDFKQDNAGSNDSNA